LAISTTQPPEKGNARLVAGPKACIYGGPRPLDEQSMTALKKRVVRFDLWYHPVMAERFAEAGDIELLTLAQDEDAAADSALAEALVYQITSAKDELEQRWFATPAVLERAPKLLAVSTTGAGYDTVDVEACTAAGVLVVNQAGANARAVAEHTLAMILDVAKRIGEGDRLLRSEARGYGREDIMGREIAGQTLGLVGLGHVGRRVARLAAAFEMDVLAVDPWLDAAEIAARGATKVELDELLERADVVSLHCPRDRTTLRMIDAAAFARMKPGAIFITTARGGIHDEAALLVALESGHLAGAGIDVWDTEPPPTGHLLLRRPNVLATYHTAGVTHQSRYAMAAWAADQVIQILNGAMPARLVNPEVLPAFRPRFEAIMGSPFVARPAV
jgi:D-3-phosphoglycerate dehydrogenase